MSITINYNNSTIATLENGKATALKCSGKLMADDITVKVAIPEYDGTIEVVGSISFTIHAIYDSSEVVTEADYIYYAETGMTWGQWMESDYSPTDLDYSEASEQLACFEDDSVLWALNISLTDTIEDGMVYEYDEP